LNASPPEEDGFLQRQRRQFPNAYKSWTPEEDRELLKLVEEGMRVAEIAERLGRNKGAIRSRLKKLTEYL